MKKISKYLSLCLMLFVCCLAFVSCSNDDGVGDIPSNLIGNWHGYTAKRSVYVTFKSNGSGTLEMSYEGGSGYWKEANASFTYSVNGSSVKCKGTIVEVSSDGNVLNESFNTTFTYSGNKLTGGKYTDIKNYSKY